MVVMAKRRVSRSVDGETDAGVPVRALKPRFGAGEGDIVREVRRNLFFKMRRNPCQCFPE
jgi:hypothetical protein